MWYENKMYYFNILIMGEEIREDGPTFVFES